MKSTPLHSPVSFRAINPSRPIGVSLFILLGFFPAALLFAQTAPAAECGMVVGVASDRKTSLYLEGAEERFGTGRLRLAQLEVREVAAFVQRQAHGHSRGHVLSVVTGLRSFLRFARYRGYIGGIETDLGSALPRVANWKLTGLPKYLPRGAARQVLAQCDKTTTRGRRDYTILMLLARLGLRGGEVVDVRLDDIDWRKGEITVRSKKGGAWVRFPLPADVGQAIAGQGLKPLCRSEVFVSYFRFPRGPRSPSLPFPAESGSSAPADSGANRYAGCCPPPIYRR